MQALKLPPGEALSPSFFRDVLGLKAWGDAQQREFAASVAHYTRDMAVAASGASGARWEQLTLCAVARPGVCPTAAALLPAAPAYLRCASAGGMLALSGAAAEGADAAGAVVLRRIRAAACAALFPAGALRDVWEFDPRARRITRIVAADGKAPSVGSEWFSPADDMPGVAVADAADVTAAAPLPAWAGRDADADAVSRALPHLSAPLAAMYAALVAFAAREGATQLTSPSAVAATAAKLAGVRLAPALVAEEPDDWESLA